MISLSLSLFFFFSSRRRHTRFKCDWSSDVCSSDLVYGPSTCNPRMDHKRHAVALVLSGDGERGVAPTQLHHFGDCYLCFGKTIQRSEERRVGKECRSRWSPYH